MAEHTRPTVELTGKCTCGAVEIIVRGTVYSMFLCSCEDCQKASGGGHSSAFAVDPSAVSVTGETRAFTVVADSGATFTRHFCPVCGTRLQGHSSRNQRAVMLPAGFFGKDTDWYRPNQLIFARSHRDWDTLPDGLPRHQTYRERKET
jgi:hypothetical protein